jgi:alkaline phosphatase D
MDRRDFLFSTAFFVVASASTPAQAGDALDRSGRDGDDDDTRYGFPQGVASGDPKADSLVFWTRCVQAAPARPRGEFATAPFAPDRAPVSLTLQVALDAGFRRRVAQVRLRATATYDHTVRAKVKDLAPGHTYYYRFVAGRDVSPVGRARTAPAVSATPSNLRFAWFTCQDWSVNHWGAMSLLAQEDLDFVVHVGDYIYETVGASFQAGAAEPAHGPIVFPDGLATPDGGHYASTLADYRTLYRTYRGDARLQAVHARFPMIAIWDDHEFSDDCWRDHQTYTNANLQQTARRRAANQAWVEYMPVDFGDVAFDAASAAYDNLRIYRDFRFGTLLHLVMTDERLYRDDHLVPEAVIAQAQGHDPVNGSDSIGARYFIQQPVLQQFEAVRTAQLGRAPSILGAAQTAWWKDTLRGTSATWKVWGNELMLSRLWLDLRAAAPAPFNALYVVNGDAWDGFPAHRAELLGFLRQHDIRNVVAITGDLHAFQCGVVRDTPDPQAGTPVLVDFVSAGISSSSFYSYVKAGSAGTPLQALVASPQLFDAVLRQNNPDFAYVDHDAQGYATATVTPTHLVVTFNKVAALNADGTTPAAPLLKRTRITLPEGTTTPLVEDDV